MGNFEFPWNKDRALFLKSSGALCCLDEPRTRGIVPLRMKDWLKQTKWTRSFPSWSWGEALLVTCRPQTKRQHGRHYRWWTKSLRGMTVATMKVFAGTQGFEILLRRLEALLCAYFLSCHIQRFLSEWSRQIRDPFSRPFKWLCQSKCACCVHLSQY